MKPVLHILLLSLTLSCIPMSAFAEGKKDIELPHSIDELSQYPNYNLQTLEKLLTLSPQQLENLRTTLKKIETMSPDKKKQLLAKIGKFRKIQRKKQEDMKKAMKAMTKKHRLAMKNYWDSLSPEAAQKMRDTVTKMNTKERDKWRKEIYTNPAYSKK